MSTFLPLSALEVRILGVLVEKEHTVPDTYPLSLNALVAGCNQKNNRSPVMDVSETEVLMALDTLRAQSLILETSGARVTRYSHNIGRVFKVPSQAVALLASLILRGPQTAAELRTSTERFHRFADSSSVEAFLTELAQRSAEAGGALAVLLNRVPGEREARWAHLLCGEVAERPVSVASAGTDVTLLEEFIVLRAQHKQMSEEVRLLRAQLRLLADALGVNLDTSD
jgi:uncharacterized protein